jgi:hypothetical protein
VPLTKAAITAWLVLTASTLSAQQRPQLRASRVDTPPKIVGVLDDAAWAGTPLETGDWRSYNPLRGDLGPERTEVRVAVDARDNYIALPCN